MPLSAKAVEEKISYISELYQQQKKAEIINIINNVDKAIDLVVKLPNKERKRFSVLISLAAKKYEVDPRIIIAILQVESDYRQKAVSHTGDYSVAQINYKIWVQRFKKLEKSELHLHKLKESEAYAIFRMAEILSILKKDHESKDMYWFARYHSNTPQFKNLYIAKLKKVLKKLLPFGPNMLVGLPNNPEKIAQICLDDKL